MMTDLYRLEHCEIGLKLRIRPVWPCRISSIEHAVRRGFSANGSRSYDPAKASRLLGCPPVARLSFARSHLNWEWNRILFADAGRFCVHFTDSRQKM